MTRKVKFALLMLAGMVINILITVICFFALFMLYIKFLVPHIPADKASFGIPILFICSFVIAFILYRNIVKVFLKKHPLGDDD